jgi:hypothetical protein
MMPAAADSSDKKRVAEITGRRKDKKIQSKRENSIL